MKSRNKKKAFTIVELVVVIAVIAVLAAVLIPTFSNIVKKAQKSSDTQLVRNLNTALVVDGKEPTTMQAALDAVAEAGYDVGKINATETDNEILWDSANNVFCYLEKNAAKPTYIPDTTLTVENPANVDYWRITANDEYLSGEKATYSVYYTGTSTEIDTTVGFDAGTKTDITEVRYVRPADATPQSVTIRMNGGKLTTNAPTDTVDKYGYIEEDNIIAVADHSSHQLGFVDLISITQGRVVFHVNESVGRLFVKGDGAIIAAVEGVTMPIPTPAPGVTTYKLQKLEPQSNAQIEETIFNIAEDGTVTTETKNAAGETIEAPSGFDLDAMKASAANPVTEEQIKAEALPYAIDSKEALTAFLASDYKKAKLTSSLLNIGSVTINRDVCIDGNGYKVIGTSSFSVSNTTSDVTLKNIYFEYIHNEKDKPEYAFDRYDIDRVYAEGNLSAIYASGLKNKLTVTGCTFDNVDWDALQLTPVSGATIVITNNTFKHTAANMAQIRYIHIQASSNYTPATVTITGNKFYKTANVSAAAITDIGCWYVKPSENSDFTGNYFEYEGDVIDINSAIEQSSYITVSNEINRLFPALATPDATSSNLNPVSILKSKAYLTEEAIPACYSGSTLYDTLQAAIDAGKTSVYLAKNNNESITIPEGKTITIYTRDYQLNGTITNNGTLKFTSGSSLGGNATINNNGSLTLGCNAAAGYTVTGNGTVSITNGATYDLSKISGNVTITGGTFTTQPQSALIAEWYVAKVQEDGTYKVGKMTIAEGVENGMVATSSSTSGTYYKTVSDSDSYSVYLQKDVAEAVSFTKGTSTYRSFYLNGYNFNGSIDMGTLKYVTIYGKTNSTSTATLTNVVGTKLSVGSYNTFVNATIKNADLTTLYVGGCGTCTIEGGSYDEVIVQNYYVKGDTESTSTGKLTITGGTFKSDKVTITNTNPPDGVEATVEVNLSDYVAEGYKVTYNAENETWVVSAI